jgi:hypothetical protein
MLLKNAGFCKALKMKGICRKLDIWFAAQNVTFARLEG